VRSGARRGDQVRMDVVRTTSPGTGSMNDMYVVTLLRIVVDVNVAL
jgi:hypothetical protein